MTISEEEINEILGSAVKVIRRQIALASIALSVTASDRLGNAQ